MSPFEKSLVGLAERIITARDCHHRLNYPTSTPCSTCIDLERDLHTALTQVVTDEADRRYFFALRAKGEYPRRP